MNSVAPNYFETMRIPLYQGREFDWNDTKASGLKMILNQSAAKLLFPGRDALGQQVMNAWDKTSYQVVAVVGDTKYQDLREPAPPDAYVPIMQDPQEKPSLSAVVRMGGASAAGRGCARVGVTAGSDHPCAGSHDDGRCAERIDQRGGDDGGPVCVLCRVCVARDRHWPLWNSGLFNGAANERNRHPHGPGSAARRSHGDGLQGERGDRGCRLGGRTDRGPSRVANTGKLPVRHVATRAVGAGDILRLHWPQSLCSYSSAGIASGAD